MGHDGSTKDRADPPVADPTLELAYEAAVKALEQQGETLGNLRNRAAGLLSAVTIATTFSAGLGLFTAEAGKKGSSPLPHWAQWTLLALLLASAGFSIAVMWPNRMAFGVDAQKVMDKRTETTELDKVREYVIDAAIEGKKRNDKALTDKFRLFRYAVLALAAETGVLLLALILKGS